MREPTKEVARQYMRVAWFGHKARKRGNGLVTRRIQLTEALCLVDILC